MFDRIKALISRWNELREVGEMSDRELADLGMSRTQVEAFVRMPQDVPDRVLAMAEIFGLSQTEVQADHAEWMALLETCGTCHDRSACKHVLERGALSRPADCSFCLNAHSFESKARVTV